MNRLVTTITLLLVGGYINANGKPIFTSVPVIYIGEDVEYNYRITANDPDNDSLTFIFNNLPNWISYVDYRNDTALIYGIPTDRIDNFVSISVTNGVDTTIQEFNIDVVCDNCCLTFTTLPRQNIQVDSLYIYHIFVTTLDRNAILNADSLPDWLNFNSDGPNSGTIFGTPTINDTGDFEISIKATRESTLCPYTGYQNYTLHVINSILPSSIREEKYVSLSQLNLHRIGNLLYFNNPHKYLAKFSFYTIDGKNILGFESYDSFIDISPVLKKQNIIICQVSIDGIIASIKLY